MPGSFAADQQRDVKRALLIAVPIALVVILVAGLVLLRGGGGGGKPEDALSLNGSTTTVYVPPPSFLTTTTLPELTTTSTAPPTTLPATTVPVTAAPATTATTALATTTTRPALTLDLTLTATEPGVCDSSPQNRLRAGGVFAIVDGASPVAQPVVLATGTFSSCDIPDKAGRPTTATLKLTATIAGANRRPTYAVQACPYVSRPFTDGPTSPTVPQSSDTCS